MYTIYQFKRHCSFTAEEKFDIFTTTLLYLSLNNNQGIHVYHLIYLDGGFLLNGKNIYLFIFTELWKRKVTHMMQFLLY